MKLITDIDEFHRRTGLLLDLEFEPIGIEPDTALGLFDRPRLPELIEFCKQNPRYHIISFHKNTAIRVNAPIESAAFYVLGEGDSDPELMCIRRDNPKWAMKSIISKFDAD